MENIEKQILNILGEDCRYSAAKIAVMLGVSEEEVSSAIAAMEADMEASACDYEKLNELVQRKDAAQAELDALYERWERLSEEAEV